MVVSQNKGTPIWTPIYHDPYYGDPQKGTPNFGKTPNGLGAAIRNGLGAARRVRRKRLGFRVEGLGFRVFRFRGGLEFRLLWNRGGGPGGALTNQEHRLNHAKNLSPTFRPQQPKPRT